MRIQIDVAAQEKGWIVRRNGKLLGVYGARAVAVGAAENFARASARHGDTAVVRVVAGGEIQEERNFVSDIF